MPSYLVEDITFIGFHCVGNLRPGGFDCGSIDGLDNYFGNPNLPNRGRLGQRCADLIVRTIALTSKSVQPPPAILDLRIATVRQAQPEISMSPLAARHGKS